MEKLIVEGVRTAVLTFRGGMGAIRSNLPHTRAVAAERHQSGDDGGFPKPDVPDDHHPPVDAGVGALQLRVDLVENPVPADEDGLGGDAGHLEEQRLQRDVGRSVRCEAYYREETQGKSMNINANSKTAVWESLFNLPQKSFSLQEVKKVQACLLPTGLLLKASGSFTAFSTKGVQRILQEEVVYSWGKGSWKNRISCLNPP